jgi:hypothetical protein
LFCAVIRRSPDNFRSAKRRSALTSLTR